MKYDFTSILDRRNKDALAVDVLGKMPDMAPNPPKEGFDIIPMWVADMNFPVLPAIQEAMISRVKEPLRLFPAPGRVLRFHHPLARDTKRRDRPDPGAHRL